MSLCDDGVCCAHLAATTLAGAAAEAAVGLRLVGRESRSGTDSRRRKL